MLLLAITLYFLVISCQWQSKHKKDTNTVNLHSLYFFHLTQDSSNISWSMWFSNFEMVWPCFTMESIFGLTQKSKFHLVQSMFFSQRLTKWCIIDSYYNQIQKTAKANESCHVRVNAKILLHDYKFYECHLQYGWQFSSALHWSAKKTSSPSQVYST